MIGGYVQKQQPTLYYLDGGPKRSFVFEELQPILDPYLLVLILVLVPSALSVSSVLVCIQHIPSIVISFFKTNE